MSAADDILTRMRRRKSGWTPDDFRTLYEGFGFGRTEGGSHTTYTHPDFPRLFATVPRHRVLKPYLAKQAVTLLDDLARLKAAKEQDDERG